MSAIRFLRSLPVLAALLLLGASAYGIDIQPIAGYTSPDSCGDSSAGAEWYAAWSASDATAEADAWDGATWSTAATPEVSTPTCIIGYQNVDCCTPPGETLEHDIAADVHATIHGHALSDTENLGKCKATATASLFGVVNSSWVWGPTASLSQEGEETYPLDTQKYWFHHTAGYPGDPYDSCLSKEGNGGPSFGSFTNSMASNGTIPAAHACIEVLHYCDVYAQIEFDGRDAEATADTYVSTCTLY